VVQRARSGRPAVWTLHADDRGRSRLRLRGCRARGKPVPAEPAHLRQPDPNHRTRRPGRRDLRRRPRPRGRRTPAGRGSSRRGRRPDRRRPGRCCSRCRERSIPSEPPTTPRTASRRGPNPRAPTGRYRTPTVPSTDSSSFALSNPSPSRKTSRTFRISWGRATGSPSITTSSASFPSSTDP